MNNEYVTRPVWNAGIRGRRAEVWHWRSVSAWDLAAHVCGDHVTEDEYNAAFKLLDSVQRYGLADAHEWERENSSERYCNSAYHKERERKLWERRKRLDKRLERYGVRITNYGLYATLSSLDGKTHYNYVHYMD